MSSVTRAIYWTLFALGVSSAGCAGRPVNKIDLPIGELPKEYISKFDVKDAEQTTPAKPTLIPLAEPVAKTGKKKRKSRKRKVELTQPEEPQPYVVPNRRPQVDPLWVGEKLTYEITYFGMAAADVTTEILPFKEIDGRKVYHIQGRAQSSSVFSLFYKLSDTAESFMDYEGLFSYRFHLLLSESKQSRDALELYDQEKHQTFYWNRWNHVNRGYTESKEYGEIEPWAQDSVSALFYVRTLPLPTGTVVTLPVASEGKVWDLVVTVIRREMLETPLGKIQTVVIKPETKFRGVMEKKGDSYMWLTDDDRHLLVRMEAKVRIGTVVARLKKVESLGTPPQPQ